ncbi:hypothetical protein NPIL_380291 [Nephila pilipes]|uniref:Uncharacterized protein n=1 Tax=Nephila pilipes TaxID=299642 RepID=A0A8X6QQE2_NEPPI|nr:hypothetical protein NPIL_380291 [Nephila pilipes]
MLLRIPLKNAVLSFRGCMGSSPNCRAKVNQGFTMSIVINGSNEFMCFCCKHPCTEFEAYLCIALAKATVQYSASGLYCGPEERHRRLYCGINPQDQISVLALLQNLGFSSDCQIFKQDVDVTVPPSLELSFYVSRFSLDKGVMKY